MRRHDFVSSSPPIVAALQPTTNYGGRPVTLTTAPVRPVSTCTSERHDMRHGSGGGADNECERHAALHAPRLPSARSVSVLRRRAAPTCPRAPGAAPARVRVRPPIRRRPSRSAMTMTSPPDAARTISGGRQRGVVPSDRSRLSDVERLACRDLRRFVHESDFARPCCARPVDGRSRCPIAPAPTIATRAIARILWGRVCFPQIVCRNRENDPSPWRSTCTEHW